MKLEVLKLACFLVILIAHSSQAFFIDYLWSLLFPDPLLQASCMGECMFDLTCRLSYGQKLADCGGFYQVCCDRQSTGRSFLGGVRQDRKFAYEDYGPIESEKSCGQSGVAARRVVGGTDAGFGSFPWMALIRGGSTRCGGALIRPSWVITAGHCVKNNKWPSRYRVYLGEYHLYSNAEPLPRQKYFVSEVIVHPSYKFTPQADRYDVALLKLDRPATMMPHISPVCLPPTSERVPLGKQTIVAGWGATKVDSVRRPKVLQAVDVWTLDNQECERWHMKAGIRVRIYPEMLCAGHKEGGKDACQGDSGGPLMNKDSNGTWSLIGVVSAGYSCAKPGQPGIYHRISETASWISRVTSNHLN